MKLKFCELNQNSEHFENKVSILEINKNEIKTFSKMHFVKMK